MRRNLFFIVYGASGSGKSTILKFVKDIQNVSVHRKDTTRSYRKYEIEDECADINYVKSFNEDEYIFIHYLWGNRYGIRKDLISKAQKNKELHFIVIGDVKILKKFKSIYPNTVTIYVHCDPSEISRRFLERDSHEWERRKKGINKQIIDFINNNTLFDHIIINSWDIQHTKKQALSILKLYE